MYEGETVVRFNFFVGVLFFDEGPTQNRRHGRRRRHRRRRRAGQVGWPCCHGLALFEGGGDGRVEVSTPPK